MGCPIALDDICCEELARDVRAALERTRECHARTTGSIPSVEAIFDEAMTDVIRGIEARRRFQLLKRFIAHGSLLPSWDTKSVNSRDPLDDEELAACIDFICGHMVIKFQGKLAELLAAEPVSDLVEALKGAGRLPLEGKLVFGGAIRCVAGADSSLRSRDPDRPGIEGPDALVFRQCGEDCVEVSLLAEIKSTYVSPKVLRKQWDHHVTSVSAGVRIQGSCFPANRIRLSGASGAQIARVLVRPASWELTRQFEIESDEHGARQVVMEDQALPADVTQTVPTGDNEWSICLAWSHDALRAAAFCLTHRYMAEVGIALAMDPQECIRKDMEPAEAGQNDFMAQLHVAVARQGDVEQKPARREKTIELYNVLGFGWALGHRFRDPKGRPAMLFLDDLIPSS